MIHDWVDNPSVRVTVRPYSDDFDRIGEDLRRASLVLMPSRAWPKGFGLVGLEAVVAGTPLLVSAESGLGGQLRIDLDRELVQRLVVPVEGREDLETRVWSSIVKAVLLNREAAFATAAEVRRIVAATRLWAAAARTVLDAVGG